MALTLFWRCEGTTLDGTHDYCAGTATITTIGGATIDAAASKVGTNGVLTDGSGTDYFYFDPTGIVDPAEGSYGFWLKQITSLTTGNNPFGVGAEDNPYSTSQHYLFPRAPNTSGEITAGMRAASTAVTVDTSGAGMVADTWYFVTMSWKVSTDQLRIRVYDATGSLLNEGLSAADLSTAQPSNLDRLFVGQRTTQAVALHIDNVFVGNEYADADTFLTYRNITSYTEYNVSTQAFQYQNRVNTLLRM